MIRKNDIVMVETGKYKGKTGKVISILVGAERALVEKLNVVKRHQKPTQKLPQGGIVEKEASLHLSNLKPYCKKCNRGVRVRMKAGSNGSKERICYKCGENIG